MLFGFFALRRTIYYLFGSVYSHLFVAIGEAKILVW